MMLQWRCQPGLWSQLRLTGKGATSKLSEAVGKIQFFVTAELRHSFYYWVLEGELCRLLSAGCSQFLKPPVILYYVEFPNMATSFLIASKEEESRKVNPIISCNTITQSCTSRHTHPITFTIFHFLEASQVLPSHKKRGSYEGGNHSGHIKSVNNTVS
jgi:hypothetical protein